MLFCVPHLIRLPNVKVEGARASVVSSPGAARAAAERSTRISIDPYILLRLHPAQEGALGSRTFARTDMLKQEWPTDAHKCAHEKDVEGVSLPTSLRLRRHSHQANVWARS